MCKHRAHHAVACESLLLPRESACPEEQRCPWLQHPPMGTRSTRRSRFLENCWNVEPMSVFISLVCSCDLITTRTYLIYGMNFHPTFSLGQSSSFYIFRSSIKMMFCDMRVTCTVLCTQFIPFLWFSGC